MEQSNQNYNYEDEISLKELIETLIKGKKLIAICTIAAIVVSAIFSFIILPEKYEANIVLLTSPINIEAKDSESLSNISGLVNQYPNISVETYIEMIKSNQLLNEVISELNLVNNDGKLITANSLRNMIEVENIDDTNLISLVVTNVDSKKAMVIANSIGENFIEFVSENNKKIGLGAAIIIDEQLKIEEKNLEENSQEYVNYITINGDIKALENEVNMLLEKINIYKGELIDFERSIDIDSLALKTLLDSYGIDISVDLAELDYSIDSDYEIIQDIKLDLSNVDKVQDVLIQVEITKLETSLISNISSLTITREKLETIESDFTEKQAFLSNASIEYDRITRYLSLARADYNTYQNMRKEAIAASTSDLGKSNVIISSYAEESNIPVSPNKMLNLAIGLVLGLMVGVFVVFFKKMWESDND